MTLAPILTTSGAPDTSAALEDQPGFLEQCAEMGKTIFARLRTHIQGPRESFSESADTTIRELDSASRILKRLQETYIAAQREIRAKDLASNSKNSESPSDFRPSISAKAKPTAHHRPTNQPRVIPNPYTQPLSPQQAVAQIMNAVNAMEAKYPKASARAMDSSQPNGSDSQIDTANEMDAADSCYPLANKLPSFECDNQNQMPVSAVELQPSSSAPLPKLHPTFRPPQTRNKKKKTHGKQKRKR